MDAVTCPDAVRTFLQDFADFHEPVYVRSSAAHSLLTDAMFDALSSHKPMFTVFSSTHATTASAPVVEYRGRRSQYGSRGLSISTSAVGQAVVLVAEDCAASRTADNATRDEQRLLLERERGERELIQEQRAKEKQAEAQKSGELRAIKAEADKIKAIRDERGRLQAQVAKLDRDIERHQSELAADGGAVKRERVSRLQDGIAKHIQSIEKLLQASTACAKHDLDVCAAHSARQQKASQRAVVSREVQQAQREVDDALRDVERARKVRDECQQRLRLHAEEMQRVQELVDRSYPGGFAACREDAKNECPEKTIEEIEVQCERLTEQLNAAVDNKDVLSRYQRASDALTKAREDLSEHTAASAHSLSAIDEQLTRWKEAVATVTHRISKRFSEFMTSMGFRGEVSAVTITIIITITITITKHQPCHHVYLYVRHLS